MPAALFFPWGYGGGAGYTARSIALAERLIHAGWQAAFAGCGANRLVEEAGLPLLPQRTTDDLDRRRVPAYLPFPNVERVWACAARYYRPSRFDAQLAEDDRLISEYRPDVVIIDMTPTAAIAARMHGLPLVSLADASYLSPVTNSWMPWCELEPSRVLPFPSAGEIIVDRARRLAGLALDRPNDVLWGDVCLVPSIPALDPLPRDTQLRGQVHWIGPLSWDPPSAAPELPAREGPNVYVTIGSGATVGVDALQAVVDACADQPWNVFISCGYAFTASIHFPPNVTIGGFTGIKACIAWSDVVVSHGGYSTVMEVLRQGRPQVVIPFHSGMEHAGRQMVEGTDSGVLLYKTRVDAGTHRVAFVDRSGAVHSSPVIRASDVRDAITDVLADRTMRQRAAGLGALLEQAERQADLPEIVTGALAERRPLT